MIPSRPLSFPPSSTCDNPVIDDSPEFIHTSITSRSSHARRDPRSSLSRPGNARLEDIMDLLGEKGLDLLGEKGLDPRSPVFYRTENSEETAGRREEVKRQGNGKE